MSGQRAAARIARRELRRRPATTLLVALLVAVPVAAMVVAAVVVRTTVVPAEQVSQRAVGNAQAALSVQSTEQASAVAAITSAAPDARVVPVLAASGWLTPPGQVRRVVDVVGADFADPVLVDRFEVAEGRLPTTGRSDEVAVSPVVAERWGVGVGSEMELPELGVAARVTGIARTATSAEEEIFTGTFPALAPDTVTSQLFVVEPFGLDPATVLTLEHLTDGGAGSLCLREGIEPVAGAVWRSCARPTADPAVVELSVAAVWLGGALALAVMAVVISSAFTIGARRQLRTLGLLSAGGAPPAVVRGAVVWQGAWVGVGGSVLGIALGAGALRLLARSGSSLSAGPSGWWRWEPRDLVPMALVAVLAAVGAAWLPARTASRVSVLHALAGRRPLAAVRPRVIVGGLASVAVGLGLLGAATVGQEAKPWRQNVWIAVGIVGGLAVLAGAVAAAPVVVGIAGSLARRCRGTAHLALRSVGRQRSRYGSVVAGIAAVTALCLVVAAGVGSSEVQEQRRTPTLATNIAKVDAWGERATVPKADLIATDGSSSVLGYQPSFAPVGESQFDAVEAAIPGATRVDTPVAQVNPVWRGSSAEAEADSLVSSYLSAASPLAAPATDDLLDALGVGDDARAALDRGEAVALGAPAGFGEVVLQGRLGNGYPTSDRPGTIEPISVTAFPDQPAWSGLPTILLPPAEAARVGLADAPAWDAATLFVAPEPLTTSQLDHLGELRGDGWADRYEFRPVGSTAAAPPDEPVLPITLPTERTTATYSSAYAWLAAVALAVTALVVALGLALAARDNRDERDVLEAIGAPPKLLRRLASGRASLLALLGAAIALPAGLLPVWVVTRASVPVVPFVVPWSTVLAVVVVTPVAIGALAHLGGAVTSRFRPATASRFAAD